MSKRNPYLPQNRREWLEAALDVEAGGFFAEAAEGYDPLGYACEMGACSMETCPMAIGKWMSAEEDFLLADALVRGGRHLRRLLETMLAEEERR